MNYAEAERMVEESDLSDDEKQEYALWASHEDRQRILDSADPIHFTDDGVKGVPIIGDYEISSPQILPRDVDGFGEETLHDPPLKLVEDLIEPEMRQKSRPMTEQARFRDRVFYEVEEMRYEIYLDRVEDVMSLPELRELVAEADEGRWSMELSENNVLVFTRRPEPGTEYTGEHLFFEVDVAYEDISLEEAIGQLEIERQLAEYAIEAIDGQKTRELTEIVTRHIEDEEQSVEWVEDEEAALDEELTFETEEDEVVVGEQIVVLGGLYMTRSLDG